MIYFFFFFRFEIAHAKSKVIVVVKGDLPAKEEIPSSIYTYIKVKKVMQSPGHNTSFSKSKIYLGNFLAIKNTCKFLNYIMLINSNQLNFNAKGSVYV